MREDKRVKRTRRSLRLALMALVAQQPFEQITVKAICDRAEISRITFYTHYSDKYVHTDATAEHEVEVAIFAAEFLEEVLGVHGRAAGCA